MQVRICTTPNWKPSLPNGSGILSDCKNVKYLKFLVTKHYESEGQPYDGVITEDDNDTYGSNIDVRIGRHHSEKPILYIVKDYPELEKKEKWIFNHLPVTLNFAVIGTLSFSDDEGNYYASDFVIAQGYSGAGNNWWVATPNGSYEEPKTPSHKGATLGNTLKLDQPLLYVHRKGGYQADHMFTIQFIRQNKYSEN